MAKKTWITRDLAGLMQLMISYWEKKPIYDNGVWRNGGKRTWLTTYFSECIFGIKLKGGPRSITCRRLSK